MNANLRPAESEWIEIRMTPDGYPIIPKLVMERDGYCGCISASSSVILTARLEGLPLEWINNVSTDFTALLLALIDETWMQAKDEYIKRTIGRNYLKYQFSRSANRVSLPQPVGPVYTTVTRKRGRP